MLCNHVMSRDATRHEHNFGFFGFGKVRGSHGYNHPNCHVRFLESNHDLQQNKLQESRSLITYNSFDNRCLPVPLQVAAAAQRQPEAVDVAVDVVTLVRGAEEQLPLRVSIVVIVLIIVVKSLSPMIITPCKTLSCIIAGHVQTIGVKRPGFGSGGRSIQVTVNAFEARVTDGIIYHYDGWFLCRCRS